MIANQTFIAKNHKIKHSSFSYKYHIFDLLGNHLVCRWSYGSNSRWSSCRSDNMDRWSTVDSVGRIVSVVKFHLGFCKGDENLLQGRLTDRVIHQVRVLLFGTFHCGEQLRPRCQGIGHMEMNVILE